MSKLLILVAVVVVVYALCINEIQGHGMLLDPPGRSSRWHTNKSAPINYNDNELFCGGWGQQYTVNGGKCGLCGDTWELPTPRPNELGGKPFGEGIIVKSYQGSKAKVGADINNNHLGYIYYELCNLDESNGIESEECFKKNRLTFADGKDRFHIGKTEGMIESEINWPTGINCKHCVLRWTYYAGNNWGNCEDGTGSMGCGPQETFKSCADISVSAK